MTNRTPEEIARGLTEAQRRIVRDSMAQCETDTPFRSFRSIGAPLGLSREEVAAAARPLRAQGVMCFESGLWTDDGEPYGSGYALTDDLGLAVRSHLESPK